MTASNRSRTRSNCSSKSSASGRSKNGHKIAVLKTDFEKQAESMFTQLDHTVSKLSKQIDEPYNELLLELPTNIKTMALMDYSADIVDPENLAEREIDLLVEGMTKETDATSLTCNQQEQEDSLGPLPPTGCRTVNKHRLKSNKKGAGRGAPAITPKFDPRLPVTPLTKGARHPKRGEQVILMSQRGSPLLGTVALRGNARTPGLAGNSVSSGASTVTADNTGLPRSKRSFENFLLSTKRFTKAEATHAVNKLSRIVPDESGQQSKRPCV